MKEITIKLPDGITKEQVESYIQSLRNDYIVRLSKEDAKAAYKELAKSNSIKKEVIDFIKTMDYIPTPSQYDFILYSIVRGSRRMYERGISTETMSNDEFDIAYEEAKQNIYSYIRNNLEDPKVKCDYLPD
jgi:pimeloyl-CoA synthetase